MQRTRKDKQVPRVIAAVVAALMAAAVPGGAQVASHAPTNGTAKPAVQTTTLTPTGKPVVRVNGTVLTDRDLLREMFTIFPYARQHGGKFPAQMEADIRQGALKMMVFDELVYQEAKRRKMAVSAARLEQATKEFRTQFGSEAEFQAYMQQELQGSSAALRERIRRAILIDDLLKLEVKRKSAMTEAQVRAYYDKNPANFSVPEKVSIQTISLVIPDNPTPQQLETVRKRAEDLLRQAKAAKDYEAFGILAEKVSEDDWRVMMGDHKWIDRSKMPPEVAKVAFSMKKGETSDLIRAENSFCIVRLNDRQPAKRLPYPEVKAKLKKELETGKVNELRSALNKRLQQNATIEQL